MTLAFQKVDRSTYDVFNDDTLIGQVNRRASMALTGRWAATTADGDEIGDDYLTRRAAAEALEKTYKD